MSFKAIFQHLCRCEIWTVSMTERMSGWKDGEKDAVRAGPDALRVMIMFVMVRLKENYRQRQTERGSDGNTLTQALIVSRSLTCFLWISWFVRHGWPYSTRIHCCWLIGVFWELSDYSASPITDFTRFIWDRLMFGFYPLSSSSNTCRLSKLPAFLPNINCSIQISLARDILRTAKTQGLPVGCSLNSDPLAEKGEALMSSRKDHRVFDPLDFIEDIPLWPTWCVKGDTGKGAGQKQRWTLSR